jgi:hypothetical protein
MSYTISSIQKANIQLEKAIVWCSEQSKGLDVKFIKSLDLAMKYIQKNPLKSQIKYNDEVRIKYLRSPKFGVHYIIRNQHIYIVGIYHTNQDSENW